MSSAPTDENLQSDDLDDLDESDLAAIQEAVDALNNGDRGVPFEEFDRAFRVRHNIA